jgi:hypothetical protein
MASTRARFRELISREVGGYKAGTVDLAPSSDDADAQRSIYSSSLTHAERPTSILSYQHAWIGRFNEGRQVQSSSFTSLAVMKLTPPDSGPLTLTFWGYGTVGPLTLTGTASEQATQLQTAIQDVAGLETVEVSATGSDFRIGPLPSSEINAETDAGTLTNGFGQILVARPFRSALTVDTAWELSSWLPIADDGNESGLNYLVNKALSFITTIAQVPYHFTDEDRRTDRDRVVILNEAWLSRADQIIGIWRPFRRIFEVSYVPPGSGTFDLAFDLGLSEDVAVSGLAYDASNETIADAISLCLQLAGRRGGVACEGTATKTIRLTDVYYAEPAMTASAGTVGSATTTQVEERLRFDDFKRVLSGHKKQLELQRRFEPGESFEIEMVRPAGSWGVPQTDYQTLGTTWQSMPNGLLYDLDQADADEATVMNVGAWLACLEIAKLDDDKKRDWLDRAKVYADIAADMLTYGPSATDTNSRMEFSGNFYKTATGELRG